MTWPMDQLRVAVLCVQKVILLAFVVQAFTSLDGRFLKFLIQLIDIKVEFFKIEFLDLIAYFWLKQDPLVIKHCQKCVWGLRPKNVPFNRFFVKSWILKFLAKTKIFSDRRPPVPNHEKTQPMYQLRVVALCMQKVLCKRFFDGFCCLGSYFT